MNAEYSAIDQVISAIVNYTGYETVWNKTVFGVQDFDSDIPSGNIHNGLCPFVAIRGGISDDFTQIAGDLYEGTIEMEIFIAISSPLVFSRASWEPIYTLTAEIERAIATLNGEGFRMPPSPSKTYPVSLNQMVTRVLTISAEFSECRAPAGPPSFSVDPVLSGMPKEGNTLTVSNGTAIGTEPITYSYDWLNDGISIGAPDQNTYIVPSGIEGETISCELTATNGILPDAVAESIGLEILAVLPPVNTVAPAITGTPEPDEILTCSQGTWTGDAPITYAYQWYRSTVLIPGEIATNYTVLLTDVGEDIGCVVTATNIAAPGGVEANSNLVLIESGWVGIEDSYPGATLIYSNFIQRNAYAGNAEAIRVIATPSDIGFSDNKFDGDAWDTATSSGANVANATDWYDQSTAGNDAIQTVSARQPPTDRNGAMIPDYSTQMGLVSDVTHSSDPNEKVTVFFNLNSTNGTASGFFLVWDVLGVIARAPGSNLLRFSVGDSGNIQFADVGFFDGLDHWVAITADGTDITIEVDNAVKATYTAGYSISVTNQIVNINSSLNGSGAGVNALKDLIIYNGISFTPTQRTDIFNIWSAQNV